MRSLGRAGLLRVLRPTTPRTRGTFAAVFTLLCNRKLVGSSYQQITYNSILALYQHIQGYAQFCELDTKGHYHVCVCVLELLRSGSTEKPRKCSYQGKGNHHPKQPCSPVRLQSVRSGARKEGQTAPQGERIDLPRLGEAARLPPDANPKDRVWGRDFGSHAPALS